MIRAFQPWIESGREILSGHGSAGDARKVGIALTLIGFLGGIAVGCLLITFVAPAGALVILAVGIALGYAARSFVSHRRRIADRRARF